MKGQPPVRFPIIGPVGFRSSRIFLFLACACLFAPCLRSQPVHFETIAGEELTNETIVCMLKDRRGFMWFGTYEGIVRYDGYSFKTFRAPVGSPPLARDHLIYAMLEDKAGYIWIGSVGNGLDRFDPVSKSFRQYRHDSTNQASIGHNDIYALHEDRYGQLWVGTRAGLDRYDPAADRFIHVHPSHREGAPHSSDQVTAIYEQPGSQASLWVGTWGDGFFKYDVQRNSFVHFRKDQKLRSSLSDNFVRFFYQLSGQPEILWIGTNGGGLNAFDTRTNSFSVFYNHPLNRSSISSNAVRCMLQDRAGNAWIGTTGGGLNLFDPSTELFKAFRNRPGDYRTICSNDIISLFEDETGILWAGTRNGLARFVPPQEQFTLYQSDPNERNSLSDNFLYSLCEDRNGILWISSGGGLNRFDPRTQSFTSFRQEPGNPGSLANNFVRSIYEDKAGRLWVGNTEGALHLFDRNTGQATRISVRKENSPANEWAIRAIRETKDGTLWVGTSGGLFTVDRASLTSRFVVLGPIGKDPSHLTQINCLYEDPEGILWIGTHSEGVVKYDPVSRMVQSYRWDAAVPGSISHNTVTFIFEARDGTMWVATAGGGLNKFDKTTGRCVSYTKKAGLPSDVVYGALEDSHGNLWLSTNYGLSRFTPATGKVRNFNEHDGLQGMEFNTGSFVKSATGVMYLGGTNGLNAFSPDRLIDNNHIPPIVITKISVFDVEIDPDTSLTQRGELILSNDQNSFSFEFAALDFRNQRQNRYAYRLEPLDQKWIECGSRRFAAYSHLGPGTYTFRVKGSNDDGVWNETGVSLVVIITPPWWRTTWAYLGYAVGILGLFYAFRRYEKNRERLKHQAEIEHLEAEKLREIDQLKTRFFTNISHEFRTPLTLIEGPVKQLQSGEFTGDANEHYDLILRNTHHLLHLVNQLLDLAKIESGGMKRHVRQHDLAATVKSIASAFESTAKQKGIELMIEGVEECIVGWFDRDAVEKIVTNLLSNAFKFTNNGAKVCVDVRQYVSELQHDAGICVTDTGMGIPPEELDKIFERFYQVKASQNHEYSGTGIGLALTKELVELNHGGIHVASDLGKGSMFSVWFPIGRENVRPDEIVEEIAELKTTILPELSTGTQNTTPSRQNLCPCNLSLPILLIVEDNRDMRKYMRTIIDSSYRVIESADGEDGLRKAIENVPDIIVSDVMMPKMDGFAFCREVKSDERTSHIPVILLTAKAELEQKIEGLETGAEEYLTKPFDARELRVRVRNLIEQRRKLRERYRNDGNVRLKEISVTSADGRFLKRAMEVVEVHIAEQSFSSETFAREMFLSRMQLHRKLKALTDHSPGEFVRIVRMERASQLLRQRAGTIGEIAYQVGYDEPSHFTEAFRRQFGVPPSEFAHQNSNQRK